MQKAETFINNLKHSFKKNALLIKCLFFSRIYFFIVIKSRKSQKIFENMIVHIFEDTFKSIHNFLLAFEEKYFQKNVNY